MKKLFILTILALFITGSAFGEFVKKLNVITTIFPLYDMAREVGGDKVEVTKLLPAGVEAHTFDPKAKDIVKINNGDVFVYTGEFMEPWAKDIFRGVSNSSLLIVDASKGVTLMKGNDPHIWLDLSYAKIMTDNIAKAFGQKDPANKDFYMANASAYKARLADLDQRFTSDLTSCKIKTIVYAGHFAFGYFAKRYGLAQVSPYKGFSPDAEPSPKSVAELINTLKSSGSKVIYYEELIDPKIARVISEETGVKMDLLNGGHNVSDDEMKSGITFLSIMEENLKKLRQGLQCQ
ncbi:MAG: zinc ABC transporter substrate-binding protein [Candidatus Omnitrophica bacterium]|nr:zinc ABC transporter substrate-binding protein [Candidatus Omnitrophota bacterium]